MLKILKTEWWTSRTRQGPWEPGRGIQILFPTCQWSKQWCAKTSGPSRKHGLLKICAIIAFDWQIVIIYISGVQCDVLAYLCNMEWLNQAEYHIHPCLPMILFTGWRLEFSPIYLEICNTYTIYLKTFLSETLFPLMDLSLAFSSHSLPFHFFPDSSKHRSTFYFNDLSFDFTYLWDQR